MIVSWKNWALLKKRSMNLTLQTLLMADSMQGAFQDEFKNLMMF